MDKIASPKELVAALRDLLEYAEGKNPSREKLASELLDLAERTAKGPSLPGWSERLKAQEALVHAFSIQYPDVPRTEIKSILEAAISSANSRAKSRQMKQDPTR